MRAILFALVVLMAACGKPKEQTSQVDLTEIKEYRDKLCEQFDISEVPRCDRVTFDALAAAYCPVNRSISKYHRDGMWHRDLKACYTDHDVGSKSECSLDGYMGVIHYALEKNKPGMIQEMKDYLEPRRWYCGPGFKGATNIYPLRFLIADGASSSLRSLGAPRTITASPIGNFRGHLLALYLWADVKAGGSQTLLDSMVVQELRKSQPDSPLYEALYQRFHKGEYDRAIDLLYNLKECSSMWGSCALAPYVAASVAVMEGR